MSHYARISVEFQDPKMLVEALVAVGIPRDMLVYSPEGRMLEDYEGKKIGVLSHVSILKKHVAGSQGYGFNDIGFDCKHNSVFICDYARDRAGYNSKWLGKVTQEYAVAKTKAHYAAMGKQVIRKEEAGKIYLYVKV